MEARKVLTNEAISSPQGGTKKGETYEQN